MAEKMERYRIASMKGGLNEFSTWSQNFRAVMHDSGAVTMQTVERDKGGRRKFVCVELTHDDVVRLHHTLGEALKLRGVYVELETEEERDAKRIAENEKLAGTMARFNRNRKAMAEQDKLDDFDGGGQ